MSDELTGRESDAFAESFAAEVRRDAEKARADAVEKAAAKLRKRDVERRSFSNVVAKVRATGGEP